MNKQISRLILLCVLALFLIGSSAFAAGTIYVNSSDGTLSGGLDTAYAIGASGTARLGSGQIYALTADGVEAIGSGGDFSGGGGLVSDSGTVSIKSDTIKVGLKYYYSAYRDSGVTEARLENAVGSGYAFGYYDSSRQFHEVLSTAETRLSMRVTSGTGIGVYATDSNVLLYQVSSTSPTSMLAIHPLSAGGDAVTWFSGYKYYGDFEYAVLGGGKISVINVLDIEKYVMGVCASEMNDSWPTEALKAQAVAARTYGQKNIKNTVYYYNCGFDVTADTYCQAYTGCGSVGSNITSAVNATANQYISYNGTLIDALYFSSDGGATEDNVNVNGNSGHPYLAGVIDPYEAAADSINPLSSWTVRITAEDLAKKVGLSDVADIDLSLSDTGNVIGMKFMSSSGTTAALTNGSHRAVLGLYSIRFSVSRDSSGDFVFKGSGWGHSLGMSQYGAYAMAKYYDKTYKDILGFYYTGVSLSYGT